MSPFAAVLMQYAAQLQQEQQRQQQQVPKDRVALQVTGATYHPPGVPIPILKDISMTMPANRLGLVIGRSGSGKTTLLQMIAGFMEPTSGDLDVAPETTMPALPPASVASLGRSSALVPSSSMGERMKQVGVVFQFPERHFLGRDVADELTFTWPRVGGPMAMAALMEQQTLAARMQEVLAAVGLSSVPLQLPPQALSGGQQRRLALALQLMRRPKLLLLDEPLAGLDWRARNEVVAILRRLKQTCTLLVVSHDLREISPLVDCAWRMNAGGTLDTLTWPLPPDDGSSLQPPAQPPETAPPLPPLETSA